MDPSAPREGASRSPSLQLVRRIRAGDADAWTDLYARYRDPLLLAIRLRLGSGLRRRLDSEDVLQSVMKDAVAGIGGFEPRGAGSLLRWLRVRATNKIRRRAAWHGARKRSGDVPLDAAFAGGDPAGDPRAIAYRDAERYEKLERAMRDLPEEMREVVLLRQVEGLSNEEAAAVLRKTPEAASKSHARAMARLALRLGAQDGPP